LLQLRNRTAELVVKRRYSPRVKLFVAGLIAVGLIVGSGAIYNHGLSMAGFDKMSAYQRQMGLKGELSRLQDENQELRESLARAQRALQMDQTAYQDLDQSLKDSAKEIVKLREELTFYRNIISPANKVSGLQIQGLHIERQGPDPGKNEYRYKLVLVQALKHDRQIYGRAKLDISGMQAGEEVTLSYPTAAEKPLTVNFKYFQDVEGVLKLPANFKPLRIKVSVTTTGNAAQTIDQLYTWPAL
jgi:hypothetical protein